MKRKRGDIEHRVKLLCEYKTLKREGCTSSKILAMVPEMKPLVEPQEDLSSDYYIYLSIIF